MVAGDGKLGVGAIFSISILAAEPEFALRLLRLTSVHMRPDNCIEGVSLLQVTLSSVGM
jgi:hypothetical protein